MHRQLYDLTENAILERLKIRCLGIGLEYLPWFTIRDVPSQGRCWRVLGWKHGRIHHLLSDGEYHAFLCFEKANSIMEIREQFRLKREITIEIAAKLGIKHPVYTKTGAIYVMTTDFLLFVQRGNQIIRFARTFKPKQALNDEGYERMLEKFEIERIYWEMEGVDWAIFTESELPMILVQNMKELHSYKVLKKDEYPFTELQMMQAIERMSTQVQQSNATPLSVITSQTDHKLGLRPGDSLAIVKYLAATEKWDIDLHNVLLDPTQVIPVRNINI